MARGMLCGAGWVNLRFYKSVYYNSYMLLQYNHQYAMTMAGMLPANVIHPSAWAFPQDYVVFPDNALEESGVEIPIHTDEEMEIGTEASYHFG